MKLLQGLNREIRAENRRIETVPTLILRPKKGQTSDVGLLWIHGGGYILGMKEMAYMGRAVDLVKKYGVAVFSPGYRLAWRKPYPAAVNDCFAVLRHMDAHRKDLGIRRIMVGGESAGGGLCAAVCMMARDRGIPVDFQMPLYPMLSNLDTESSRDNHGRIWNTRRNHLGWRIYLRKDAKKTVSPYAAPANQRDYRNLPPCYTFVGDGEPFYAETLRYVEELRRAGVDASVDFYHTDVHAFDMLRPRQPLSRAAIAAFERHFEGALRRRSETRRAEAPEERGIAGTGL